MASMQERLGLAWSSPWTDAACTGTTSRPVADIEVLPSHPQRFGVRKPRDSSCCGVSGAEEWCPADYDPDAGDLVLIDAHSALREAKLLRLAEEQWLNAQQQEDVRCHLPARVRMAGCFVGRKGEDCEPPLGCVGHTSEPCHYLAGDDGALWDEAEGSDEGNEFVPSEVAENPDTLSASGNDTTERQLSGHLLQTSLVAIRSIAREDEDVGDCQAQPRSPALESEGTCEGLQQSGEQSSPSSLESEDARSGKSEGHSVDSPLRPESTDALSDTEDWDCGDEIDERPAMPSAEKVVTGRPSSSSVQDLRKMFSPSRRQSEDGLEVELRKSWVERPPVDAADPHTWTFNIKRRHFQEGFLPWQDAEGFDEEGFDEEGNLVARSEPPIDAPRVLDMEGPPIDAPRVLDMEGSMEASRRCMVGGA